MAHNTTYSPNRLQKAIGNIAGAHLGFPPSAEGGVKPLPSTTAEIVEIKHIYPHKRCVEFCFLGSDTLHTAHALLDYWHKDGTDQFQPPANLNIPTIQKEPSWPHTTPENSSPDLLTILQLILLSGAPTAPALPPIIQQLNQTLGGQQNTVKLLQTLSGTGSLDLKLLMQIAGIDPAKIKEIINTTQLSNKTPTLPGVEIPNTPNIPEISLPDAPKVDIPNIPPLPDVETPQVDMPSIPNEIPKLPRIPQIETPLEPLYGAVIPLKGDKTQGYLLLGFIKL